MWAYFSFGAFVGFRQLRGKAAQERPLQDLAESG